MYMHFPVCFQVLREGSMASLNFVQNKRFQGWRNERLEVKPVTEELVGLGSTVQRGPDWCYDATDDDKTPEDGGSEGLGLVVGWRTKSGSSADFSLNSFFSVQRMVGGQKRVFPFSTVDTMLHMQVYYM